MRSDREVSWGWWREACDRLPIVTVDVFDQEAGLAYAVVAQPSVLSHGGRYLVAGPTPEPVEGTWDFSRLLVIEFPDMDRIREWYDSPNTDRPARSAGTPPTCGCCSSRARNPRASPSRRGPFRSRQGCRRGSPRPAPGASAAANRSSGPARRGAVGPGSGGRAMA
nr:DUF1330 domain-containing protein [Streptomyces sp. SID3343]